MERTYPTYREDIISFKVICIETDDITPVGKPGNGWMDVMEGFQRTVGIEALEEKCLG